MKRATTATLLLLATTLGCGERADHRRAFYFWRTVFELSATERETPRAQRISQLYLHFFDVVLDPQSGEPTPVGKIELREAMPQGVEVVPVVFLRNDVLAAKPGSSDLAGRVWRLMSAMAGDAGIPFHEVQLDCDWTDSTGERFFALCRDLHALGTPDRVGLSATIRLHQVKYSRRTGIPPVDRGTLMFYNIGRLGEGGASSIFNAADASRYVESLAGYPLPLDVALPIFSWVVHAREGRVVGLIEKTTAAYLDELPLLRRETPASWVAAEPGFFHGTYLKQGDTLRIEAVTPAVAREATALLAGRLPVDPHRTISLFDLDERNLANFSDDDLDALFELEP